MIQIETVKINDITFYEKNAKTHPKDQIRVIANSIKAFGFNVPILLDKDNVIIAGHGRVLAAIQLNMKELPAIYKKDLTPQQVRAFRIADNKTTISPWDYNNLRTEIKDLLEEPDLPIESLGWDATEIDKLLKETEESTTPSEDVDRIGHLLIKCPACGHEFKKKDNQPS